MFDSFFNKNDRFHVIKLFRLMLYLWVIVNTLILLPAAEHFWGASSYIALVDVKTLGNIEKIFYLLHDIRFTDYHYIFVGVQLFGAVLAFTNRFSFLGSMMVYFSTMNLDNRAYVTLDGGNNLIHLILFYSCFLLPTIKKDSFLIPLGKLVLLTCQLQVVTVYLVAGLLKVTGNMWPSGLALFYTLNVDSYSHPILKSIINYSPIFSVLGSYATLAFQLSFPYLVWLKKTQRWVLLVGTMLHLGIAFGMGLMSFGFAMTVSYFCFYSEERAEKVFNFIFLKNKVIAGFDRNCNICMRFAGFMSFFDFSKNILVDNSRNPKSPKLADISYELRNSEMYIYDISHEVYYKGFDSIVQMFRVHSIFRIFTPPLLLISYLGLGDKVYSKISKSKWRKSCSTGSCPLEF